MIKELKKTYELVPEITGEKGRWLEINEVAGKGYDIRLMLYFDNREKFGTSYIVTYEELKSAKFDYEDHAINTLCAMVKNHFQEDTDNE
ncbi:MULTISPECIES: hypothetical protein [Paenibacillus]|uniref:hypothetical protein n=1 Tax=Paenibacillus TaxID=44249 RepID=UPI00096F398A|nr:hypothetical protein [Paenibacillus odorifer]OMD08384.1 hypothetical protein BJP50_07280 [Paenibacillus odorifer]